MLPENKHKWKTNTHSIKDREKRHSITQKDKNKISEYRVFIYSQVRKILGCWNL